MQSELLTIPGIIDEKGGIVQGSYIFTMGANSDPFFNSYELGHYDNVPKRFPVPVVTSQQFTNGKGQVIYNCIKRIFAKENTLYAIDISGFVWTWGVDCISTRNVHAHDQIPVNQVPRVV